MNEGLMDWLVERWCECVTHAYELMRGERLSELRGSRVWTLDERGVHPASEAIGAALVIQSLYTPLRYCELDPKMMRRQAQADAYELFRQEVIASAST